MAIHLHARAHGEYLAMDATRRVLYCMQHSPSQSPFSYFPTDYTYICVAVEVGREGREMVVGREPRLETHTIRLCSR